MQYPPAKDHAAQDRSFSDMRQIATNAPNGIAFALTAHQGGVTAKHLTSGGGYYPTTGIIVIIDEHTNSDKPRRRTLPHADEPRL